MALVLTFDGAVGSALGGRRRRTTPAAPAGPFTYREGKAQAIRELAEREGIDLAASWAYSDSESDLPMLRAVGHPVAVNPDSELARVAREEGWEILRFERLGRRLRFARRAAVGRRRRSAARRSLRRRAGVRRAPMSLHELTAEQREIRDLARRFADEQIAPHAAAWDREHHFPRELFAELGELGLMGVCVPERARRRGRGLPRLRARARGALARRRRRRRDRRRAHERVHAAAPRPRHARRSTLARRWRRARSSAAFALTEAGVGLGRGAMRTRDADGRDHRRQAVDHQRLARATFLVFAREDDAHQRVRRARAAPTASRSRARRRSWA